MASASSYAGRGVAQRCSPAAVYPLTNEKNRDIRLSSGGKFSFDIANDSVVSSSSFSSIARLRCLCRRTPSWHHHDTDGNDDQHVDHNAVQIRTTLSNKVRRRPCILEVNPNPRNGLASMVVDWMERLMIKLLYHPPLEPNPFLSGNFAPVEGEAPLTTDLTVRGCLPDCLNGEFMGVGPNSKFAPIAGYQWFDGDGMVHALCFKDGKASYVSHFVQTSRLKQEEFFGGSKFGKIGDLKGLLGLASVGRMKLREKLNILDVSFGTGQANTSLVYHGGMILALQETDKPYVLKVQGNGDFETLGILDYDGKLSHSFTAHPKVDPFTGEMFAFSCGFTPPFLTCIRVSKEGVMHDPVDISIPEPVLMHDFAITENYVIFMDLSLCFRPKDMLTENTLVYSVDPTKKSSFGVLPRYAKNDLSIKWFELPSCFIFHNANAWEDGDELVLISSRIETLDLDVTSGAIKENPKTNCPELYEMRFNMGTGVASQRKLSAPVLEFPHINQQFTGRKHRYVYGSSVESTTKVTAVIKFDLHKDPDPSKPLLEIGGNIEGIYELGPGKFGSSVLFVPCDPGAQSEEDDGYLIFFEHDENTGKSYVDVIDAKTMSADPVAVIELPCRVPYLFHTCFLTEEQLREQAT